MKNGTVPQEKISALADGGLEPSELDSVLASLRQPEGRKEWDLYHQIGDVLRSEDMAIKLSPDFAARMAARLDAEPVILAPAVHASNRAGAAANAANKNAKRYMASGIAAVLAAFAAYLVAPGFMTGENAKPEQSYTSSTLASASSHAVASAHALSSEASASLIASADVKHEAVVLRDPNIDEYLLAHQRYSPSLYDTTQFVRSATFETEARK